MRVQAIFAQVVELDEGQRASQLRRLCGDDEVLRGEVQSLLVAHASADERFLEEPPAEATLVGAQTRFGEWTVVKELGAGGMGRVFEVERTTEDFTQRAAAKVLPLARIDAALLERFRLERQSLAKLEHPGVARLLEGGTTDEGLPYFVMEYVDGEPIDVYCNRRSLDLRERLSLFLDVCAAVQHAHQNLIVHRDIKPPNILVGETDGGQRFTKLLDFGIAKILDESTRATEDTRTRWLTPHYASPEQIRADRVTTASDIYSLGVLLYRLTTGRLPFEVATEDHWAYERAVCELDPIPPRRRDVARRLPEDLDWILMKALRREPAQRYASVASFAEDLQRLLKDQPVLAREGTLAYTLRRFVARHRSQVLAGAAFLVLLAVGIAALSWSLGRVQGEADRAERIHRFLQGVLRLPDPDLGGEDLAYVEAVLEIADRIDEEFAADPVVCASLHSQVGITLHRLGRSARAREELQAALDVLRPHAGDAPVELARCLARLSELTGDHGDHETAVELAREAVGLVRGAAADELTVARLEASLAAALLELSDGAAEARDLLLEARGVLDAREVDAAERVRVRNNLGLACRTLDDTQAAEEALGEALALSRAHLAEDHPARALILYNLGSLLSSSPKLEDAARHLEECVAVRRVVLGPGHPDLALALNQLAGVESKLGRLDDALAHLEESIAVLQGSGVEDHDVIMTRVQTLDTYGGLLHAQGLFEEALEPLEGSVAGYAQVMGEDHRYVDFARKNLAKPLFALGRLDEAARLYEEALAGFAAREESDTTSGALMRIYAADVWLAQGRLEEARAAFAAGLTILEENPERHPERRVAARLGLWTCAREREDPAAALATAEALATDPADLQDAALRLRRALVHAPEAEVADLVGELTMLLGEPHPWSVAAARELGRSR